MVGVGKVATVKKLNTAVVAANHIEEKEEKSRSESSE